MLAGLRNKRRKKAGRLNTHIMDDYVEMDDSQDGAETPVAMRMGAGRRPTAMLRPLSGTSDRQYASPRRALLCTTGDGTGLCLACNGAARRFDDTAPRMPDGSLNAVFPCCLAVPRFPVSYVFLTVPKFLPGFLNISPVAWVLQDVGRGAAGAAQEARPARL